MNCPFKRAFINIICLDLFLIAGCKVFVKSGFMRNKIFVLWWNMTDYSSVLWFSSRFVLCFAGCFKYFF